MNSTRSDSGWLAVTASALLVALAAGLAFAMSLGHGFLQSDFVTLSQFFGSDGAFELPRRPALPFPDGFLPFWTHLADSFVWGANAFGHHLSSLLIHVVTSILVFAVIRRVLPHALTAATFAAVFFAISALHGNAVGYVSGRDVALATLFGLGAVLAALRREPTPVAAVLAYVAALLCHPAALTAPLLALLLAASTAERLDRTRLLRVFVPLLVIGVIYVVGVRLTGNRIWRTDATLAVLQVDTLLDTVSRLVLPLNQDLTNPTKAPILRWFVLAVLLPLALVILFARRTVPWRMLAVGLGWILLLALPVLSSARLTPDLAESRTFYGVVPGVAFLLTCLFFGDTLDPSPGADPAACRRARVRGVLLGVVFVGVLGLCLYKTHQAYAGADRLTKHVRTAAIEATTTRPADTQIVILDPPASFAGAPVFGRGLPEALAPPFCSHPDTGRIVTAYTHAPERALKKLGGQHPPVTVLWMNHRGWDPDRPFVAVSPELPRTGEPVSPFLPPRFSGPALDYWTPLNGLTGSLKPEGFEGTVAGGDPWFLSPPMAIPLHWIAGVKVRLRVQAPSAAPVPLDLFWTDLSDPNGFTGERSVRRVAPTDGSPQVLTFRFDAATTRGRSDLFLARLRLDPPPACSVRIEEIILLPGPDCPGHERVAASWTGHAFSTWVAAPDTALESSGDGLKMQTEGGDPYAVSPTIDLDGAAVRAVEVTMRVDAAVGEAEVFWELDEPAGFSAARSRRFKVHAGDGRYHKYTIRFADRGRLPAGSRLKRIRIDPSTSAGTTWIRDVRIYQGTKLDG